MHIRFAGLWRHRDFMKLWGGQAVSNLGSHVGCGALRFAAILLLAATPWQLSLLAVAALLPTLLLSLFTGVLVDRVRRRPLLIGADLGRALALLMIPLAAMLGALRIEHLYAVAGITGALTMIFEIAYPAFLPTLIAREQLLEGNSKLAVSDSVAEIAGPPLGGLLVQLISAPLVLLVDAISFVCSAVAFWRIRAVEPLAAKPAQQPKLRHELSAGMRLVGGDAVLRALLGAVVTQNLAGNMIGVSYDLYLIRELGMSPALVGLTIGVGGVGALFGALLAERVVARFGLGPTLIGTMAIAACGLLIPLAGGPLFVALPMVLLAQLADVAIAIAAINVLSLRQITTPDGRLGQVNASFTLLVTAASVIGALLGGALGQAIGLRATITLGVIGVTAAVVWIIRSPIRSLH